MAYIDSQNTYYLATTAVIYEDCTLLILMEVIWTAFMDYVELDYLTMQPGMINLPSIERTVPMLYYEYYYCGSVQWFLFQTNSILFG